MSEVIIKISFLFNYILPNSFYTSLNDLIGFNISIYYINRSIYNIILLFFSIKILKNNNFKLKKREIILIAFILFRVIVVKDLQSISLLSLIFIDRICFIKNKENFFIILTISILFCFLYSIYFYDFNNRPISTSIGGINQSGFFIFILYLFCQKFKFKFLTKLTLIMGTFTFSRNFLLAVFMEKIIEKVKVFQKIICFFKLNYFFKLSILTFVLMYSVGFVFEKYVEHFGINEYKAGFARYTSLADGSNLYRFKANNNVIKYYRYNSKKLLMGTTLTEFKEELKGNSEKYNIEIKKVRDPHNFFYKYLLKYGVFSFFLFYYIGKILKKISNENLGIFYGFYIYSIFLGVGFYDSYLLMLKFLIFAKRGIKWKN